MFIETISLAGLRNCLRKFNEGVKYAKSGRWSIAKGGYDLAFQLYYKDSNDQDIPVIDCIQGAWDETGQLENNCLADAEFAKIAKVIMDEYKNITQGGKKDGI